MVENVNLGVELSHQNVNLRIGLSHLNVNLRVELSHLNVNLRVELFHQNVNLRAGLSHLNVNLGVELSHLILIFSDYFSHTIQQINRYLCLTWKLSPLEKNSHCNTTFVALWRKKSSYDVRCTNPTLISDIKYICHTCTIMWKIYDLLMKTFSNVINCTTHHLQYYLLIWPLTGYEIKSTWLNFLQGTDIYEKFTNQCLKFLILSRNKILRWNL